MSAPEIDDESRFFWEGLRAHRLLVQRCGACRALRFPPLPACPDCGRREREVVEAKGEGRLYSWITVQRALSDEWKAEVPYTVGVVELAAGCRVLARIEPAAELRADAPLRAFFVDHPEWTELRFRPGGDAG
jgi:uncharacterized OB-fold protein